MKDDGTEVLCPHPSEQRTAEEVTGLAVKDLFAQKRIRFRQTFLCLECGALSSFEPKRMGACSECAATKFYPVGRAPGDFVGCLVLSLPISILIGGLVYAFTILRGHIPSWSETLTLVAFVLGGFVLLPIVRRFTARRTQTRAPLCPKCRKAKLTIHMVAVS